MRTYTAKLSLGESSILIGKNVIEALQDIGNNYVALCSNKIDFGIVKNLLDDSKIIFLEESEELKDFRKVFELIRLINLKVKHELDCIIAIGGGTISDVAGFIASIYKRGIMLVNVPTTLLGMVDAALGGKNAINFDGIKNLLGTFYQPKLVLCDLRFLETLPTEEFKNGLAEVLKYCIIMDENFNSFMVSNREKVLACDEQVIEEMVYRSVSNKMAVVEKDERDDKELRIVLNFGHTIGHAIETGSMFKVKHGKAISFGMVCETYLASELGIAEEDLEKRVIDLLSSYGLPVSIKELNCDININLALEALKWDKKRRNSLFKIPLPTRIGTWRLSDVDYNSLKSCFMRC